MVTAGTNSGESSTTSLDFTVDLTPPAPTAGTLTLVEDVNTDGTTMTDADYTTDFVSSGFDPTVYKTDGTINIAENKGGYRVMVTATSGMFAVNDVITLGNIVLNDRLPASSNLEVVLDVDQSGELPLTTTVTTAAANVAIDIPEDRFTNRGVDTPYPVIDPAGPVTYDAYSIEVAMEVGNAVVTDLAGNRGSFSSTPLEFEVDLTISPDSLNTSTTAPMTPTLTGTNLILEWDLTTNLGPFAIQVTNTGGFLNAVRAELTRGYPAQHIGMVTIVLTKDGATDSSTFGPTAPGSGTMQFDVGTAYLGVGQLITTLSVPVPYDMTGGAGVVDNGTYNGKVQFIDTVGNPAVDPTASPGWTLVVDF